MLGEDHSLTHEFPEHLELIAKLAINDRGFAKEAKRYDTLDKEIRVLELDGAPIDDDAMHQLKHERAVLKDSLYEQIVAAGEAAQ